MKAYDDKVKRHLPEWLKRPLPKGEKFTHIQQILRELNLATVCDNAACPNRGECYSHGTATFMIMGTHCTRNCQFCAVAHGDPAPLDADEPENVADAVKKLYLKHVVITSVTRDDLDDGGAAHFARTIRAVRRNGSDVMIEVLTPDFGGCMDSLDVVYRARPDVFNHNLETVRRLTGQIRSGADYDRSLTVLLTMSKKPNPPLVKSGLMLGLGETEAEILESLQDLRRVGVDMLTLGQYLRPSKNNWPVHKFYPPEEFDRLRVEAQAIGFGHVAAGPFVRSSYHAELSLKQKNE